MMISVVKYLLQKIWFLFLYFHLFAFPSFALFSNSRIYSQEHSQGQFGRVSFSALFGVANLKW